jgi:hypothetical protein
MCCMQNSAFKIHKDILNKLTPFYVAGQSEKGICDYGS